MEDCIFCNILNGSIPSHNVYEDAYTYAFLDINPISVGHTLVIPKTHAEDVFGVSKEDWSRVLETVRMIAPHVKEAVHADGINIIVNNKRPAGQLVDHVHVHIVPRFINDGLQGFPQHKSPPEALEATTQKIREQLVSL